jgi:glycosyltransferase involved in cell wall biosynthesis
MPNTPKVSVVVPTYNTNPEHLRQCLSSIVSQETSFDFEILVVDDASTNGTPLVVREFAHAHSDIRLIEHPKNLGVGAGYKTGFLAAKGTYVAVLDHDDYWIDSLKLQKQVDFLDKHLDYEICFTNGRVEFEGIDKESFEFTSNLNDYDFLKDPTFDYLAREIEGNYISNLTVMYRRQEFDENYYPEYNWFCDWYNHIWHARFGRVHYIHDVTAVHRRHKEASSLNDQIDRDKYFDDILVKFTKFYEMVIALFPREKSENGKYYLATRRMFVNWMFSMIGDQPALADKVNAIVEGQVLAQTAALRNENNRLRSSTIFKVGRIVTWPARVCKRILTR